MRCGSKCGRRVDVSLWWDELDAGDAPALPGPTSADVCIVGAGYTGLWTAYYLKKAAPHLRDRHPGAALRRLRRLRPQRRLADQLDHRRPRAVHRVARAGRRPPLPGRDERHRRRGASGSPLPRASTPTSPRAGSSWWPATRPSTNACMRSRGGAGWQDTDLELLDAEAATARINVRRHPVRCGTRTAPGCSRPSWPPGSRGRRSARRRDLRRNAPSEIAPGGPSPTRAR